MVVDTILYDILGVRADASPTEIRNAFIKKAKETHPDKNPNDPKATEKFQELNNAYEILKDPHKRQKYDSLGMNAFNSNCSQQPKKTVRITKNIVHELNVTLEDLYSGKDVTLKINRKVICQECNGKGCQKGKQPKKCYKCRGTGQIVKFIRCSSKCPGLWKEVEECTFCDGTGEVVEQDDRCFACNGERVVQSYKMIKVHIEPGMKDGDKLKFVGDSDEKVGYLPGNVIIVLKMKYNTNFERKNDDLKYKKTISLSEAIIGMHFIIDHLDGRKLYVETPKNLIIEDNSMILIEGEGMPKCGNFFEKGNLFVQFHVYFPYYNSISDEFRKELIKCMPIHDKTKDIDLNNENVYKVNAQKANTYDFNGFQSYKSFQKDEDDEKEFQSESKCEPI